MSGTLRRATITVRSSERARLGVQDGQFEYLLWKQLDNKWQTQNSLGTFHK